jgi:hypothetical protein
VYEFVRRDEHDIRAGSQDEFVSADPAVAIGEAAGADDVT